MARYSVGAYTYEDDSVIPQIFDEVTGTLSSLAPSSSPESAGTPLPSRQWASAW